MSKTAAIPMERYKAFRLFLPDSNKLESKFKAYPFIKIKSEQEIHSCPLINILI